MATLLTVVQTCRAQGLSVLEFLRQAISQSVSKADSRPNYLNSYELIALIMSINQASVSSYGSSG